MVLMIIIHDVNRKDPVRRRIVSRYAPSAFSREPLARPPATLTLGDDEAIQLEHLERQVKDLVLVIRWLPSLGQDLEVLNRARERCRECSARARPWKSSKKTFAMPIA